MTLPPDLGAPYLSPHLGGRPRRRPTGHRGSDSHGLLAATHQQAGRLLGHPLQLGSPPLISPHPGLLQPPHNCRLFRAKWRLRSAPQRLLASRRTPTTLTDDQLLLDKASKVRNGHTHTLLPESFCLSSLVRPDRDRDNCHDSDFLGRTRRRRAYTDVFWAVPRYLSAKNQWNGLSSSVMPGRGDTCYDLCVSDKTIWRSNRTCTLNVEDTKDLFAGTYTQTQTDFSLRPWKELSCAGKCNKE